MTIVTLNRDKLTVSERFRKSDYFAFLDGESIEIVKNSHKHSKSPQFFEYFNPLGVERIYTKALGYKTFLKLNRLGVDVYFTDALTLEEFNESKCLKLDLNNAEELCTLGHTGR